MCEIKFVFMYVDDVKTWRAFNNNNNNNMTTQLTQKEKIHNYILLDYYIRKFYSRKS
jgi:hypothetical protein